MDTTNMTARESVKQAIEHYIDVSSVESVLDLVGEICSEKAQHISENWQDQQLAATWDRAAKACFRASVSRGVKLTTAARC